MRIGLRRSSRGRPGPRPPGGERPAGRGAPRARDPASHGGGPHPVGDRGAGGPPWDPVERRLRAVQPVGEDAGHGGNRLPHRLHLQGPVHRGAPPVDGGRQTLPGRPGPRPPGPRHRHPGRGPGPPGDLPPPLDPHVGTAGGLRWPPGVGRDRAAAPGALPGRLAPGDGAAPTESGVLQPGLHAGGVPGAAHLRRALQALHPGARLGPPGHGDGLRTHAAHGGAVVHPLRPGRRRSAGPRRAHQGERVARGHRLWNRPGPGPLGVLQPGGRDGSRRYAPPRRGDHGRHADRAVPRRPPRPHGRGMGLRGAGVRPHLVAHHPGRRALLRPLGQRHRLHRLRHGQPHARLRRRLPHQRQPGPPAPGEALEPRPGPAGRGGGREPHTPLATPFTSGITSSAKRSISSSWGENWRSNRSRPTSSNSTMRSATCSGVPTSPERSPRLDTE